MGFLRLIIVELAGKGEDGAPKLKLFEVAVDPSNSLKDGLNVVSTAVPGVVGERIGLNNNAADGLMGENANPITETC